MAASVQALEDTVSDIAKVAEFNSDLVTLRNVRSVLASAGFARQIANLVARSHNQPELVEEMAGRLEILKFAFKDQQVARSDQHDLMKNVAIIGGSTLTGGAIAAAATQLLVYPPIALFAVGIGIYGVARGAIENRRLTAEVSALDDIVDLLARHVSKLQKAG